MARPKGSKNRPKGDTIDEQISQVQGEIASLEAQLKERRSVLEKLQDEKDMIYQRQVMDAIAASGKTLEEVIEMLNADKT